MAETTVETTGGNHGYLVIYTTVYPSFLREPFSSQRFGRRPFIRRPFIRWSWFVGRPGFRRHATDSVCRRYQSGSLRLNTVAQCAGCLVNHSLKMASISGGRLWRGRGRGGSSATDTVFTRVRPNIAASSAGPFAGPGAGKQESYAHTRWERTDSLGATGIVLLFLRAKNSNSPCSG